MTAASGLRTLEMIRHRQSPWLDYLRRDLVQSGALERMVAEGVENADQLRFVLRNRCETVQGNYFSPPVSADQLGMMLERPFPIEQSH